MKLQNIKNISVDEICEKYGKFIWIFFIILITISRLYKYGILPTWIAVDEAGAAYDAFCLANFGVDRYLNRFPVYLTNFGGGQSALYAYLNVILIKIFQQNSIFVFRLPALLLYILSIFVSYKLISKMQDKKTAYLITFFIIICPFHIDASRYGLDCNLLAPMFILDLYLLSIAKKNYQFAFAGLSIGITLYTYSLSYIIMPVFLLVWMAYNLYFKKVKISQLLIMLSVVIIFALPLMYFLAVNMGIFSKTDFGIITVPKLDYFRSGEVSIYNFIHNAGNSLKILFLEKNTLYFIQIPFFIIGFIDGICELIDSLNKRKYSFSALMILVFLSILIPNLFVNIVTTNKGNILYIPILYFITIGTIVIIKNRKILWGIIVSIYIILFIKFELTYYLNYCYENNNLYLDARVVKICDIIGESNLREKKVYFVVPKAQPYIYVALYTKTSPYDFFDNLDKIVSNKKGISNFNIGRFKNYYFAYLPEIDGYEDDKIFVINNEYEEYIKPFEEAGYKITTYMDYYILE